MIKTKIKFRITEITTALFLFWWMDRKMWIFFTDNNLGCIYVERGVGGVQVVVYCTGLIRPLYPAVPTGPRIGRHWRLGYSRTPLACPSQGFLHTKEKKRGHCPAQTFLKFYPLQGFLYAGEKRRGPLPSPNFSKILPIILRVLFYWSPQLKKIGFKLFSFSWIEKSPKIRLGEIV